MAVKVPGLADVVEVSARFATNCARTAQGEGYCWGENSSGQVGDGTKSDRWQPTLITLPPM